MSDHPQITSQGFVVQTTLPPPYEMPPLLEKPILVRTWAWVVVHNREMEIYPSYSTTYKMQFESEVRDARNKEIVGRFVRSEVVDEKLYIVCTLTRAYKSVDMIVAERDSQGRENGKYKLRASHLENNECPLETIHNL